MRILIITQKVDRVDDVLGFFHAWVAEFSRQCEKVTVICLYEGKNSLPANVKVLSLGKEKGVSRLTYLWRFFYFIFREHKNYDSIFVHMNQVYVLLGGIFWRLWNKKISLWYVHRQKSISLWLAEKMVDHIFTSVSESFWIKSKKTHLVGHGIENSRFVCSAVRPDSFQKPLRLITVGRITPIKNLDTLISAVALLDEKGVPCRLSIIGAPAVVSDFQHLERLKKMVNNHKLEEIVNFVGSVPNIELPKYYCQSDININLTPAGGIDKTVLEGMASGAIPIVSNTAFRSTFGKFADNLIFKECDPNELREKIISLSSNQEVPRIRSFLIQRAREFDIVVLIGKIMKVIGN